MSELVFCLPLKVAACPHGVEVGVGKNGQKWVNIVITTKVDPEEIFQLKEELSKFNFKLEKVFMRDEYTLVFRFVEEADALRDCSKCKHFEDRGTDEYSCKYLREGKVVFQSDSTDTAESCPYYEGADA